MPLKNPILTPNLGVYYDRPPLAIPRGGLKDCLNIRIKEGKIVRDNMGYGPFPNEDNAIELPDPVTGIDTFFPRAGGQFLIFLTTKDAYEYDEANEAALLLTPIYNTGTVDVTNGDATVTGNGTSWDANVKAGDRIHIGASTQRDAADTWYTVDSVTSDTELELTEVYAGANDTTVDYVIRQTFTGDLFNYWDTETFPDAENVSGTDGDRWYATNGVDSVIAWDGSADTVYLLTDLDSCKSLVRYKNMLLYINITVSSEARPFSIRNSAIANPENVTTLEASEFVIHDGVDALLVGVPLGDNVVFYGSRSITLGQFVGGDLQFIFRTAVAGIGTLAGRGVADYGDYHHFIGSDAQYEFNGITVTEVGEHVFRDVIRRHSPNRSDLIQAHFDEENGEVLWIMPINTDADSENGPPERAFVQHYLELVSERDPTPVTVREIPATATGFFSRETTLTFDQITDSWGDQNYRWNDQFFQAAYPFNLFGTNDGKIMILNNQDSKDGADITSFARFGRMPLGSIKQKGTIMRLYPFLERLVGNVTINLYMTDAPAGTAILNGTYTYDMSGTKYFVSPRRTGRYMELEIRNVGAGAPWQLQGYDLDVQSAGER